MARLKRVVYAVPDPKMGFLGGALNINQVQSLNHHLQLKNSVLEADCRDLLQAFFAQRRT